MSIKEIKEQLKSSIENLSPSDIRLASKDLEEYFAYLRDRREMPKDIEFNFRQYQELMQSLQETESEKLHPASKVIPQLKRKYGSKA